MTRDTVGALKRAGCAEVWMGAESGSQKILDAMEKGTRVEQIYEARENLRRHGIRACFFLQLGYPGETREDIDKTIQMVRRCRARRYRCVGRLPSAGNEILRSRGSRARRQTQLVR